MSRWLSRTAGGDSNIPHCSFVKRKPEPPGAEFKCISDAETGCIVGILLQEGKEANKRDDAEGFVGFVYQHHIGVSLRLSKPFWNSNRAVVGDSWFASVSNTIAHLEHGLHFIGDITDGDPRFLWQGAQRQLRQRRRGDVRHGGGGGDQRQEAEDRGHRAEGRAPHAAALGDYCWIIAVEDGRSTKLRTARGTAKS
jgi:hypothetical protein